MGAPRREQAMFVSIRWMALACVALVMALTIPMARAGDEEPYGPPPPPPPAPLIFYASQSGQQTYDQADGGGNPFASALIELMAQPGMTLGELPRALTELTTLKSEGFQRPDAPQDVEPADWRFRPKPVDERRAALVLVVSDYAASHGALSLSGARTDAGRISQALRDAGFMTRTVLDPDHAQLKATLEEFAARSAAADIALLYTTGHGVEVDNEAHLLLGDFPVEEGNRALTRHAVRLSAIADAVKARRANLVLYGACRDNPFADWPADPTQAQRQP